MHTATFITLIIVFLLSAAIAFFHYFFKINKAPKIHRFLFVLRTLSLFGLGLLLVNPKIETAQNVVVKPSLSVLVDNSLSTTFFKEERTVTEMLKSIKGHKELNAKFKVDCFSFGTKLKPLDTLTFEEPQTNISNAITALNRLNKEKLGAVVLISDGNQTVGNDYEFTRAKQPIFPVVIGDTIAHEDIRISQLNVNKYSYIRNKFPVEIAVYYDGKTKVRSNVSILHRGQRVFSESITLSSSKRSTILTANLTSTQQGNQYYSVSISPLENEKNKKNNQKDFAINVLDEQTKVLVLSSFLHPDLGAIKKAIKSNKQREVSMALVQDFKGDLKAYELVIFYQPTARFAPYFKQRTSNFMVITGTQTDWVFLNDLSLGIRKNVINQSEYYTSVYNSSFTPFLQKDINFEALPPLEDKFGTVSLSKASDVLLHQKLLDVTTEQPLIGVIDQSDEKFVYILGEGLWKWRAAGFVDHGSFETFDAFLNTMVQYASSSKMRKRLDVPIEKLYAAHQTMEITGLYLDKNYKFDDRASLEITIKNKKTQEERTYPFSLQKQTYKTAIEDLDAGDYEYVVTVNGQNLKQTGAFKVTTYQIEEQFTNANVAKLHQLAEKNSGVMFYHEELDSLIRNLLNDEHLYTSQKIVLKEESLIDLTWLLVGLIALLAIEWFTRKYYGKI